MGEKVAVIGMGYVGLPLAISITAAGKSVVGIDTNSLRISELSDAKSFTPDIEDKSLEKAMVDGLRFSTDYEEIGGCDVILICVPTPLSLNNDEPDLELVLQATSRVAERVSNRSLVVIESTVSPGTTQGRILDKFSEAGKIIDSDFLLGFSPERVNPGPGALPLEKIPKLTSGVSSDSAERCHDFYSSFLDNVVRVDGTREAEFAKLLENSYRLVNIALINELALAALNMGINFAEVVNAASTKPYGFQAFYPSAGAGGHCIPIDPVYLNAQILLDTGSNSSILELAINKNRSMPEEILKLVEGFFAEIAGRRILVAGVSYKSGVSDVRNSPGVKLIEGLIDRGADVHFYDPLVHELTVGQSTLESVSPQLFDFELVLALHSISEDQRRAIRASGAKVLDLWNRIEIC